tara:strand:- start:17073 stop:17252 length:180 start_codon:yes stop_codon:yes gene_type:complete
LVEKKKYVPRKDDDWDADADREHRRVILEKSKAISEKYRTWWDSKKKSWKKGFTGHGNS